MPWYIAHKLQNWKKRVWLTVVGARLDPLSLILVFPMLDSTTSGFLAVSKFVEGFTSGILLKVGVTVLTDAGRIGAAKAWLDKI